MEKLNWPFIRWKKQAERDLLNKNTAKDINKDIQHSAQALNPKNIPVPKKTPVTQRNIADIHKRQFIKKGILGLIAGIGIAAFSKTAQAWSGFIKFSDATEQSSSDIDASKITTGRFGMPRIPDGTSGQVLTAQGTGADPAYAAVAAGAVTYNQFTSSDTWTKPADTRWVYVEVISGGGGGAGGENGGSGDTVGGAGGGGGARLEKLFPANFVGSTESVTVGATAAGGGGETAGTDGNDSSFGTLIEVDGGGNGRAGGGSSTTGGVGGQYLNVIAQNANNPRVGGKGGNGNDGSAGGGGAFSYWGAGGGGAGGGDT